VTSFTENDTWPGTNTEYANTYSYDPYSQMLTADQTVTTPTSQTWSNSTYGYDLAGNVTSWGTLYPTIQGSPSVSTQYNAANRITSQTVTRADIPGATNRIAGYDNAGNLSALTQTSSPASNLFACVYDGMNNPVNCNTANGQSQLSYDGLGHVIRDSQLYSNGTTISGPFRVSGGRRQATTAVA
jgi:YD repeat-containing protein